MSSTVFDGDADVDEPEASFIITSFLVDDKDFFVVVLEAVDFEVVVDVIFAEGTERIVFEGLTSSSESSSISSSSLADKMMEGSGSGGEAFFEDVTVLGNAVFAGAFFVGGVAAPVFAVVANVSSAVFAVVTNVAVFTGVDVVVDVVVVVGFAVFSELSGASFSGLFPPEESPLLLRVSKGDSQLVLTHPFKP